MRFIVCVHLSGFPGPEEFVRLDDLMHKNGFYKEIVGQSVPNETLETIHLPPLVYLGDEDSSCEELAASLSVQIADRVWKAVSVFVAQITEWAVL
ncbi:hypothetical protein FTW19_17515 [Terriglobus albidus]|uniref:Uncharacterized protein n=1 Tax=Terriglobus albidus TaxID=1592106 RepID=A0A5B9EHT2_9BACT|nr:hypothetical protein [Terriglobus albidus]QEE29626.1 hypothetical protein FTW19_17515 [Terriglobus albidus]